ncbi:MAG: lytic transglycosylase domain-containing protein [Firmicutes bacterium]|nr:lytic transglycosylase domain-containing protein [Bacillota bacterium]
MAKRRSGCGCGCLTVIVLILLAAALLIANRERIIHYFYPLTYTEYVETYCREYDVDYWLAMAVIREESGFDPNARSAAAACGLMQLMPETAEWICRNIGIDYREGLLWQPEANLRLGIWYLSWLIEQYKGNAVAAVAAYNGGKSNVDVWLSQGQWLGRLESAENIPFPETRRFVQHVYESRNMYMLIYD